MKINEIFYSLQGEGQWIGQPNIFIRTTGCNLRCSFCDTKYAYENGAEKTIDQIIKEIKKFDCKKICITGGEPLVQKEIIELLEKTKKYDIIIETNGSKKIDDLLKFQNLIISMDVKCPSSKMNEHMIFSNLKKLRKKDQIKFIINDKKDYNYAKKNINKYKPICKKILQPVYKRNINLADWILKDNLDVIYGIQLHKVIWGEQRGK